MNTGGRYIIANKSQNKTMGDPSLPSGWEQHVDHNTNSFFYVNMLTKQTQW